MNTSYQVARLLAYVTGLVNQELLLQVEYLTAENRILRAHAPARLRLSNAERATLAEFSSRICRMLLQICTGPQNAVQLRLRAKRILFRIWQDSGIVNLETPFSSTATRAL